MPKGDKSGGDEADGKIKKATASSGKKSAPSPENDPHQIEDALRKMAVSDSK